MWWQQEVDPGVWVGFTDTSVGNLAFSVGEDRSAVATRRAELAALLGSRGATFQFMNQVHGNRVAVISGGSEPDVGPEADAMVSFGTPLAVLVADCVPVVLLGRRDDGAPLLAVAHAGRQGVAQRVVTRTVETMRGQGAVNIRAWVGPSVCGRCYEVPEELRAQVSAIAPAAFAQTRAGTPSLDLPAAVLSELEQAGADAHRINACTMEEPRLYSHRRDAPTGRFAGVIHARP